ncbi:MAG TPA: MerR family transcriptional regulator, partial [Pseudonocardiaceae bacterium]|nr:MerR family transcriptional regulator [Pseudonocardiaceae bacterium]
LADAGVPLAEITGILDADQDEFATALVGVERRLTDRIDELIARRETLRRLARGGQLLLSDRACAILDRLPGLGFTEEFVTTAWEGLVLVKALVPESFDDYLAQIERSIEDPVYVGLNQRWAEAGDWAADDPRVEELVTEWVDHLVANPSLISELPGLQTRDDGTARNELLSHHGEDDKPAWTRMTTLIGTRLRAAGFDVR